MLNCHVGTSGGPGTSSQTLIKGKATMSVTGSFAWAAARFSRRADRSAGDVPRGVGSRQTWGAAFASSLLDCGS